MVTRTRRTNASASRSSREAKERVLAQKARTHDRYVQRKYGLAPGQYQEMFTRQEGRCRICRRRSSRRLAVDHSHITGNVRGLLCSRCNRDVVGPIDGDPTRIQSAIDFLVEMKHDLETNAPDPQPVPGPLVEPGR